MSTAAQVTAAWVSNVLNAAAITAITTKAYTYAISEDSEKELALLYSGQKINFIECLVQRSQTFRTSGSSTSQAVRFQYTVDVNYYLSKDTTGAAWGAVRDFFDTLFSTVASSLGTTWGGTVDLYTLPDGPAQIAEVTIGAEKAWRGSYRFQAEKLGNI